MTIPTPTTGDSSTLAASTAFVATAITNAISGLDVKPDVAYAATVALPANTYANGTAGVGATLTGNVNGPLIIDSVTILVGQVGQRILVAGESAPSHNGWYTITQQGVVAVSPYILTRATESDQAAEIGAGYLTGVVAPNTVVAGSTNNGKLFISVAADPFTVGTTSLTFSQVGSTYAAGTGLTLSGSTFSITTETETLASFTLQNTDGLATGISPLVLMIPKARTITGWSIQLDQGTCTIDVYKQAYATGTLPTTSIVGSGTKPAVASGTANTGGVGDWTGSLAVTANDQVTINLTAVAGGATIVTLQLLGTR